MTTKPVCVGPPMLNCFIDYNFFFAFKCIFICATNLNDPCTAYSRRKKMHIDLRVGWTEDWCEDAWMQWPVLHAAVCQGQGERRRRGQPRRQVALDTFCMCYQFFLL